MRETEPETETETEIESELAREREKERERERRLQVCMYIIRHLQGLDGRITASLHTHTKKKNTLCIAFLQGFSHLSLSLSRSLALSLPLSTPPFPLPFPFLSPLMFLKRLNLQIANTTTDWAAMRESKTSVN